MKAQDLKNSILQLAIQGKLVEQLPEDGTAEELYQKIQAEKQKLIKEGKIKKEKPLPPITEDEIPFDIPETWKWVRLTDCGSFISGYTPKPDELSSQGKIPYFKVSDMNTSGNEIRLKKSFSYLKDDKSKRYFLKNTIVYPKNGGAVFTNKKRILAQDSVVDLNTGGFYPFSTNYFDYIFLLFSMIDFRQCYKGTALPTIDMNKLKSKSFPLPPLGEQKRIVAKIEELEPLINQYDQAEQELSALNDKFPEQLKKSILQQAIQGRLVEQRPEDGTAEELYQKIQAEKQKLIKEGKIKKDKPLPPITADEIPFDIPETWKWVRLGDVSDVRDGTHDSPKYVLEGIPLVTSKNLCGEILDITNVKFITQEDADKINLRSKVDVNDILFAMIGTIGNPVLIKNEPLFCIKNMALIKQNMSLNMNYILYFLKLAQENMKKSAQGAVQSFVSLSFIRNSLIPLPPLGEQKRIVAKIEEVFAGIRL